MKKISRRQFMLETIGTGTSMILAKSVFAETGSAKIPPKPKGIKNVVILMNDQHAHNVLGCAGFGKLKTPTFDRLAADGIRFTQATCAVTPCLPSRHSLFHGLYAFQTGAYSNVHSLPLEEIPPFTMGKVFKENGYKTVACGKMHWFPYHAPVERDNYFGFDYRAGHFHETGEKMDTHFVAEHRELEEQRIAENKEHGIGGGGDNNAESMLGFISKLDSKEMVDWWSAGKAAEFIDKNHDKPFLLVCSLIKPHAAHDVPAELAGLYDPNDVPLWPKPPEGLEVYDKYKGLSRDDLKTVIANYMGVVTHADKCHARVLEALDRNGLYDETLIIFTSDHGEMLGSRGVTAFSKYNLYEQAIRVPFIVKPPKSMAKDTGKTSDMPVSLVDVFPTILDAAGLKGAERLSGISLSPILQGEELQSPRKVTLTEFWGGGKPGTSLAIRSNTWKFIIRSDGAEELYNLAEDPLEFKNLSKDNPQRISELKSLYVDELRKVFSRVSKKGLGFETQKVNILNL